MYTAAFIFSAIKFVIIFYLFIILIHVYRNIFAYWEWQLTVSVCLKTSVFR